MTGRDGISPDPDLVAERSSVASTWDLEQVDCVVHSAIHAAAVAPDSSGKGFPDSAANVQQETAFAHASSGGRPAEPSKAEFATGCPVAYGRHDDGPAGRGSQGFDATNDVLEACGQPGASHVWTSTGESGRESFADAARMTDLANSSVDGVLSGLLEALGAENGSEAQQQTAISSLSEPGCWRWSATMRIRLEDLAKASADGRLKDVLEAMAGQANVDPRFELRGRAGQSVAEATMPGIDEEATTAHASARRDAPVMPSKVSRKLEAPESQPSTVAGSPASSQASFGLLVRTPEKVKPAYTRRANQRRSSPSSSQGHVKWTNSPGVLVPSPPVPTLVDAKQSAKPGCSQSPSAIYHLESQSIGSVARHLPPTSAPDNFLAQRKLKVRGSVPAVARQNRRWPPSLFGEFDWRLRPNTAPEPVGVGLLSHDAGFGTSASSSSAVPRMLPSVPHEVTASGSKRGAPRGTLAQPFMPFADSAVAVPHSARELRYSVQNVCEIDAWAMQEQRLQDMADSNSAMKQLLSEVCGPPGPRRRIVWRPNAYLAARTEAMEKGDADSMQKLISFVRGMTEKAVDELQYAIANDNSEGRALMPPHNPRLLDLRGIMVEVPRLEWFSRRNTHPSSLQVPNGEDVPPLVFCDRSPLDLAHDIRLRGGCKDVPIVVLAEANDFDRFGNVDLESITSMTPGDLSLRTDFSRYMRYANDALKRDKAATVRHHLDAADEPCVLRCADVVLFRGGHDDGYNFLEEPALFDTYVYSLANKKPDVQRIKAKKEFFVEWFAHQDDAQSIMERLTLASVAAIEQNHGVKPILLMSVPGCGGLRRQPTEGVGACLSLWRQQFSCFFDTVYVCCLGRGSGDAVLATELEPLVNRELHTKPTGSRLKVPKDLRDVLKFREAQLDEQERNDYAIVRSYINEATGRTSVQEMREPSSAQADGGSASAMPDEGALHEAPARLCIKDLVPVKRDVEASPGAWRSTKSAATTQTSVSSTAALGAGARSPETPTCPTSSEGEGDSNSPNSRWSRRSSIAHTWNDPQDGMLSRRQSTVLREDLEGLSKQELAREAIHFKSKVYKNTTKVSHEERKKLRHLSDVNCCDAGAGRLLMLGRPGTHRHTLEEEELLHKRDEAKKRFKKNKKLLEEQDSEQAAHTRAVRLNPLVQRAASGLGALIREEAAADKAEHKAETAETSAQAVAMSFQTWQHCQFTADGKSRTPRAQQGSPRPASVEVGHGPSVSSVLQHGAPLPNKGPFGPALKPIPTLVPAKDVGAMVVSKTLAGHRDSKLLPKWMWQDHAAEVAWAMNYKPGNFD